MLELFHTPLTVLHVIVCLVVMLVVLIQPGKSGGLGAALGGAGAQQIFGGRGAGNFLSRTTWIAASVFFVTSITLAYISTSTGDSLQNLVKARAAAHKSENPGIPPVDAKPEEVQHFVQELARLASLPTPGSQSEVLTTTAASQ